ncbi:MAG: TetR/AcrR family transcriptional regulator [Sumerlaeia bacterium]
MKRKKGEASRERILDTAEQVFRKKGFLHSSVNDIMSALGASSGAIYYHFPTKKSILESIAERGIRNARQKIHGWVHDPTLTPYEKLDLIFEQVESGRRLRVAIDHLGLGLVREDRDMHELFVQRSLKSFTEEFVKLIEDGIERGDFQVKHPKAAAVTIILLFSELIHRAGRTEEIVPWKHLFENFRDTVLLMLGAEQNRQDSPRKAARGRATRTAEAKNPRKPPDQT